MGSDAFDFEGGDAKLLNMENKQTQTIDYKVNQNDEKEHEDAFVKAEEANRKYMGMNKDLENLLRDTEKELFNIKQNFETMGKSQNFSNMKSKVYKKLDNLGFNPYIREINKSFNKVKNSEAALSETIADLKKDIYSDRGSKGVSVLITEEVDVARKYAVAVEKSSRLINGYNRELSKLDADLVEVRNKSISDSSGDYSAEIQYLGSQIQLVRDKRSSTMDKLEIAKEYLAEYDASINARKVQLLNQKTIYNKLVMVDRKLKHKIRTIEPLINNQKYTKATLTRAIETANQAANYVRMLDDFENVLGPSLVTTQKIVDDKIKGIDVEFSDKPYIRDLMKLDNEEQKKYDVKIDELTMKYLSSN
ncbi:MAG: hypothetical protein KJ583_03220 [Nanoarchaeota archaeon]|nr:hypothetical protein [Nanoarchaeota archaeon]MBU1269388.1 hypothetical protein [Nanoarchaeota archaeon]MBU1604305.1 hypothetical protein [Nanoarchaeota archaeon]MBU2442898.1 hypothetical protein [Nanoarchaeota archaeon]